VEYDDEEEEIPVASRRRCRAINDLDVRIMDDESGGSRLLQESPQSDEKVKDCGR
jgi:hypothetical protein